ncbi:tRNA (adenosine(37)-N6)-threonylcarbamoyltransferase complex dimerization subunit type 1 TsaB [Marinovum sp.]|uniref:tRNA (adenosine(37)-N6)-threonylcarbamoyltransferase complex dimerization subunit type 1 TsaB n=1 Tax=Marinovum sp. TaxID=2024839 RepID=UPI003A9080C2
MTETLVLAFDTSAAHCAAALLCGDRVLASRVEEMGRGQAERLFPLLEEVLAEGGVTWRDLTALGVGTGPGNFTGIRISVAAARGLALSLGIPAVGVSALEAAAFGLPLPVTAVIDARRERAYVQRIPDGTPELVELADFRPETPVTGPGAALLSDAPLPQTMPIAEATARIAAQRFASETRPPAPLYIRPADAAPARDLPPVILDDA